MNGYCSFVYNGFNEGIVSRGTLVVLEALKGFLHGCHRSK